MTWLSKICIISLIDKIPITGVSEWGPRWAVIIISWQEQARFSWWCLLCARPTHWVEFYSASSLKQQSLDRHVAPLGHIILIPSQPVFTPQCLIALHLEIQLTPYLQLSVPPHFQPMNATLSFSRCGNSIKIITMLVM